jgi:3D (Asp-Asp-Asp) domain-containing protein
VAVPFTTLYKPTTVIKRGQVQTIQKGQSGVLEITERVYLLDGKPANTHRVGTRVVKPAKNTVIALGASPEYMPGSIPYHHRYARAYTLSARGGSPRDRLYGIPKAARPLDFSKTLHTAGSIELVATGYSPDPRENGGYTRTCTGLPIGYGAAAVDPRVVPLGTKLYVEGYGYAFACDTGGAIKGHRIDLAYDSYYVANTKGRRKVRAWILVD